MPASVFGIRRECLALSAGVAALAAAGVLASARQDAARPAPPAPASQTSPQNAPRNDAGAQQNDDFEDVVISRPDGTTSVIRVRRGEPLGRVPQSWAGQRAGARAVSRAMPMPTERPARAAREPVSASAPPRPASRVVATVTREGIARTTPGGRLGTGEGGVPRVGGDDPSEWRTGRAWLPDPSGDQGSYLSESTGIIVDLQAGSEFTGPTDDPPAIGDEGSVGYDAEAIARWDLVPLQDITDEFHVGVVAFHMNGIEKVSFSLEGGAWVDAAETGYNPTSGVREYTARISPDDPNLQSDELVELRAIAYPFGAGKPRLLEPMYLVWNPQGSYPSETIHVSLAGNDTTGDGTRDKPYATIKKALNIAGADVAAYDGCTIVLLNAGSYDIDQPAQHVKNTRWITIRPDDGLDRDSVIISASDENALVRPVTQRLKFSGLSLDFAQIWQMYKEDAHQQWYDNCRWYSSAGWTHEPAQSLSPVRNVGYGGLYVTNSHAMDILYAFVTCNLVRGSSAYKISGDVFQNSLAVIDCSISYVDGTVLTHHSDLLQYFGNFENLIIYGVNASLIRATQNIFLDHANSSFTNCAFVNVAVQNAESDPPFCQLNSAHDHVLFYHVSNPGQRFVLRDDLTGTRKFTARNVVFRNSIVERIQAADYFGPIPDGVTIDHCHFNYNQPVGIEPTQGAIAIIDSTGTTFEYKGVGLEDIGASGVYIPGLSLSPQPDRGAWPWADTN